ncbi:hypothetical protein A2U01_0070958, partial [Trifolium medium]|nr:hypothetical protein [Trifolium medium]
MESEREAG